MGLSRLLICLAVMSACGDDPPNVGGTCTATDGCDEGLTCETAAAGGIGTAMSCVKICKEGGGECRSDQSCNGITGSSTKACKPK